MSFDRDSLFQNGLCLREILTGIFQEMMKLDLTRKTKFKILERLNKERQYHNLLADSNTKSTCGTQ